MRERHLISTFFIFIIIPGFSSIASKSKSKLHTDPDTINLASTDFGNIVREVPTAVLRPTSFGDIVALIKSSYNSSKPFTIAARGQGHSTHGQAMARGGVVVDMMSLPGHDLSGSNNSSSNRSQVIVESTFHKPSGKYLHYVDVGGDMLWIDLLLDTTLQGFSPVAWTDYLYLTVGGTLSNAGISGHTFRFGPQINNVYELDVITGTGVYMTCSRSKNSDLFYGVLGGLGQFGIITRARIALEPAPKRARWVKMLYSDFSVFRRDLESLMSINGRYQRKALHFIQGELMMSQQGPPDNFYPSTEIAKIESLVTKYGIIYVLVAVKYYDDPSQVTEELEYLLGGLGHVPGFKFEKDVSHVDFLNRLRPIELLARSNGGWDVPHPWMDLFIQGSRISDFNKGVFRNIVLKNNITTGSVIIFPMNRSKWDDKMSALIPDEEVFFGVGFFQSTGFDNWQSFEDQNKQVLQYLKDAGIEYKLYLAHYETEEDWSQHFGRKWKTFRDRKMRYDPKMILSPGQKIFDRY